VVLLLCGLLLFGSSSGARSKPTKPAKTLASFDIGIDDTGLARSATAPDALDRSKSIGVKYVRVVANWALIAPAGNARPANFDPRNPADPKYDWSLIDGQVQRAVAAGFTPYMTLNSAPKWAQGGTPPAAALAGDGAWKPSAAEFGEFSHAAAVRYSGAYSDASTGGAILPGVNVWQAWNEPNLSLFLAPTSADLYRGLLNAMYDEVKAVLPSATIVAAGLAPVKSSAQAEFPKTFAERLLCIKPANGWFKKDPSCPTPAKFDILSVHPYSLGARPTQRASIDGNMFIADVIDVAQMLKAAQNARSISPGEKQLWSTEFAWFTNPPNNRVGDPPELAAKRTSIALYMLWHAGVTQVTWFALSDASEALVKGGGLYYSGGTTKPTYDAVRFPFFARQSGHTLLLWGKAPPGGSVEQVKILARAGSGYKLIAKLHPSANGVFQKRLWSKRKRARTFIARQGAEQSRPIGSRDFFAN
jgi:hypothetical protein